MKQKEQAEMRNIWLYFNPHKKVDYLSLGICGTVSRWVFQKVFLSKNPKVSGSKEMEGYAHARYLWDGFGKIMWK